METTIMFLTFVSCYVDDVCWLIGKMLKTQYTIERLISAFELKVS